LWTISRHTLGKSWSTLDRILEMLYPTVDTEVMITDIEK
jgi:hypothetical protein